MLRKILIITAVATLASTGTAAAAPAPTLGPVSIIKAGQKTPLSIPGNHLHKGATIRKGTELRSWLVTMHGASHAALTLKCGPGGTNMGFADESMVGFGVARNADGTPIPIRSRSVRVQFRAAPGVSPNGAQGTIYALCQTR